MMNVNSQIVKLSSGLNLKIRYLDKLELSQRWVWESLTSLKIYIVKRMFGHPFFERKNFKMQDKVKFALHSRIF